MAPTNLAIMQAIEDGWQVKRRCFDSSAASEYMSLSSLSQSQRLVFDATINLLGKRTRTRMMTSTMIMMMMMMTTRLCDKDNNDDNNEDKMTTVQ